MTTSPYSRTILPAWNQVVTPHSDIVQGRLSMDTFAVNLGQVVEGDQSVQSVYRDPRTFFEATYITAGLRRVLKDVLSVLVGSIGDHVLQLRTPFGGGKTHTLLSLYHLARSRSLLNDMPDLRELPDPGKVQLAVVSGISTGAADSTAQRKRTLWGELAWQLGGPAGYGLVEEQDQRGIAPGAEVFKPLIGDRPTLILLDEVLIYVENAMAVPVAESSLGRQTLVFLQRLTEAVAASPRAVMVYSLQASEQEAGGNIALLDMLSRLVQRVNAIREPVSGDEVLRVVQRRLFADLGDEIQRRTVASIYADSYRGFLLAGGTPAGAAQQEADQLRERILSSYPFHPALLDLMRERWSALPSYQRTRGALQFLATAVYALWAGNMQTQPLLGLGDVPLSNAEVRTTFLAQVGEQTQYDAVLQADLLGPHAGARTVDDLLIQETPPLRAYPPGTRIATAALLYSFGGNSPQEIGVYENDLLSSCLAPGLDRNILQTALHDLNERLLYLHRRERRYRFETQPNLNKMIIDERQRRTDEEIEARMRLEFGNAVGNERNAVVWPEDTSWVRDKLAEFQIVYLSPQWLDKHLDPKKQEQGMRLYIEQSGNMLRNYRNGLTLAVPDQHMIEIIQNAVRLILTLELLQSQSKQRQLTPQQEAELVERRRSAEGELRGGFSQLYPVVYTPQVGNQNGQPYVLDPLPVQNYSQNPQVHQRIKEALSNRVVWDNVQPSKVVTLTRLNDMLPLERQYYPVADVLAGFFSYYNWTHIWDEKVVRKAIALGVKNGTFGYVANARQDDQGKLLLNGPAAVTVQFGKDVPQHELDMGEGAFLLSAAYAQQLLTPSVQVQAEPSKGAGEEPQEVYSEEADDGPVIKDTGPITEPFPVTKPVAPGRGGRLYRLRMKVKLGDLFEVMKALERLNERVTSIEITVSVVATAKPDQPFVANTLHNLIVEPMVEASDVEVQEEQVEE